MSAHCFRELVHGCLARRSGFLPDCSLSFVDLSKMTAEFILSLRQVIRSCEPRAGEKKVPTRPKCPPRMPTVGR